MPNPVTGTTCNLSVLGADEAGESSLTYTWAVIGTPPAAVVFSLNGSNAAQDTTATFSKAGNYTFQATITDPVGLTATTDVNVTVDQTLTAIAVVPTSVNLNAGAQQQFTATAVDQFGAALAPQPSFTWTATAGTISAGGLLTAPETSGNNGTVTASSGGRSGSAAFTVTGTSAATGSLSGYVYADTTDSGQREISPGVYHVGIPNVTVTLEPANTAVPDQTVLTQIDGSYQFNSLPAGTYTLVETQPQQYLSGGKDTAGSLGGQGQPTIPSARSCWVQGKTARNTTSASGFWRRASSPSGSPWLPRRPLSILSPSKFSIRRPSSNSVAVDRQFRGVVPGGRSRPWPSPARRPRSSIPAATWPR